MKYFSIFINVLNCLKNRRNVRGPFSRVLLPLLFRLYQRAHIAATRGTEYVVYMFESLAHAETAEENNLLRRK